MPTHCTFEILVTARTSRPNRTSFDIGLNVSSRYHLGLVALMSLSRIATVTSTSQSCLGLQNLTSQSWDHTSQLQPWKNTHIHLILSNTEFKHCDIGYT